MEADMMHFIQTSNKSPSEHADALWNKVPGCKKVYDEYVLKGIFIAGLPESIRHSMR